MPWENVLTLLQQAPFQPFRIHVSDGSYYDIRHRELCLAGNRSILIGLLASDSSVPVFDRFVNVALIHVTRLEPLAAPQQSSGNGQT
jgi:hypothetical protein